MQGPVEPLDHRAAEARDHDGDPGEHGHGHRQRAHRDGRGLQVQRERAGAVAEGEAAGPAGAPEPHHEQRRGERERGQDSERHQEARPGSPRRQRRVGQGGQRRSRHRRGEERPGRAGGPLLQRQRGEQRAGVAAGDVEGRQEGAGERPRHAERGCEDQERGRERHAVDALEQVEVLHRGRDAAQLDAGGEPAERDPERRSRRSEERGLPQQEREHLPAGRPQAPQDADLLAAPHHGRLRAAVDQEPAHEQADEGQRREVHAERGEQPRGLGDPLLRRGDPDPGAETGLEPRRHAGGVGARDEEQVDLVEPARGPEERLGLGDVHHGEPPARERAHLAEVHERPDAQRGPPRTRRDPDRVAHLPAALRRQLRRHRNPPGRPEGPGQRAALSLPGHAHRGEQVDAQHLQEERRAALHRGLGPRQRDGGGHARLGERDRVERLGKARAVPDHRERRVPAHRPHRALERAERALVEDADGEHRAHAQRDPEDGEQEQPPPGAELGAQRPLEVARHARSRAPS